MCVKWIVEKDVWHPREESDLVQAFEELKIPYKLVSMDKIISSPYRYFAPEANVIFYGSLDMAGFIRKTEWNPGLYCTLENYNCSRYFPIYGDRLLNSEYIMLPYAELKRRKCQLLEKYSDGLYDGFFVRPDSGRKLFTGDVLTKENYDAKLKEFELYDLIKPHDLVLIADNHKIMREWRFVVVDKEVVSGSLYRSSFMADKDKISNEVHYENAKKHANEIAKLYQPDPCFVIDMCQLEEDIYFNVDDYVPWVIEINAFSTSAMYDADMKTVVKAVTAFVEKEFKNGQEKI